MGFTEVGFAPGVSGPRVLVLTSSFPQGPADATADFMRRYVESIDLPGRVLTPEGAGVAAPWSAGRMRVQYVPYWFPRGAQRVAHGWGITENLRTHRWARLQLPAFGAAWTGAAIRAATAHDVIVAHWALPTGAVGVVASVATDRPLVSVLHSGGVHALARIPGGRFLARNILARSTAIVASSRFVRDRFAGLLDPADAELARRRVEVLPMGFTFEDDAPEHDAPEREALEHDAPRPRDARSRTEPSVLFLGRINEIKGVDVLIRACARLPAVKLQIAGYGPTATAAKALAAELAVETVFHGQVASARKSELLDEAQVLVVPSRILANGTTEGLPVALLEGMGRGIPVVASAVGGIPDLIRDGDNGLLVPPDNPEALAKAIASVLSDPAAARERAVVARKTARRYAWSCLGPQHREVIEHAASR